MNVGSLNETAEAGGSTFGEDSKLVTGTIRLSVTSKRDGRNAISEITGTFTGIGEGASERRISQDSEHGDSSCSSLSWSLMQRGLKRDPSALIDSISWWTSRPIIESD